MDRKSFGTVLKTLQKSTCRRAVILEMLQSAISFQRFPCILRNLIPHETFFRYIQKHAFFVGYNILEVVSPDYF